MSVEKPKMMGLLPASRYNAVSRLSLLRELTSVYFTRSNEVVQQIDIKGHDLIYNSSLYYNLRERQFKHKEWIMRCFLLFAKNVTRTYSGDSMIFTYENTEYLIPIIVIKSFLYHKQYLIIEAYYKVIDDYDSMIIREIDLIPARKEVVGGQMKICVGAVLAVDAMEKKEKLKVCIVGSAHEPGINSKSAYSPLFWMVTHTKFEMYDMLEEEGEEIINTNSIVRYRRPFTYDNMLQYDLFIDDAYIQGRTAIESLMIAKVRVGRLIMSYYPDNYSIKIFSESLAGNYYHQIVDTTAEEKLLVSRNLIPNYKQRQKLGACGFCRELKYFLKGEYQDAFYKEILKNHTDSNKNCYPAEWYYERYKKEKEDYKLEIGVWEKIEDKFFKIQEKFFFICENGVWKNTVRKLLIDMAFSNQAVEMKEEHVKMVEIVISDDMYLTALVKQAKKVYKVKDGICFKLKEVRDKSYKFSGDSVGYITAHLQERRVGVEFRKKQVIDKQRLLRENGEITYHVEGPMLQMVKRKKEKLEDRTQKFRRVERDFLGNERFDY